LYPTIIGLLPQGVIVPAKTEGRKKAKRKQKAKRRMLLLDIV